MAIATQTMKIVENHEIAPGNRQLSLEPSENFNFIAGQFISLHIDTEEKTYKRSYSIASSPKTPKKLDFAISYIPDGVASEFLFNAKIGDEVSVSGPAGKLVLLPEQPKRYILAATGTGVTPYRSMLAELCELKNTEVVIIFGVKNQEMCIYADDFIKAAENNSHIKFMPFYSREEIKDDLYAQHGHVQDGLNQLTLNPENDIIYLCGNPNMIDDSYNLLIEKGFNARNVRREKYISSK